MIKNTLKILIFFIFILLGVFINIGYVNDDRIKALPIEDISPLNKVRYEAINHKWPDFKINSNIDLYKRQIVELAKKTQHKINFSDSFMENPFFVNISTGTYPHRVEARSGIALNKTTHITFTPPRSGFLKLNLSAMSLSKDSKLHLFINDELKLTRNLKHPKPLLQTDSWLYKKLTKYLNVDPDQGFSPWTSIDLQYPFRKEDQIKITCQSKRGYCFTGKPIFYRPAPTQNKRNVLFILIDTLRYDAITQKTSPFLYNLKQQSTSYPNTIAAGNMTSPSTNALLSCQKPTDIGIGFSYSLSLEKQHQFYAKNQPSFPRLFQNNGWKTAMIGNISTISEALGQGVNHGFDEQVAIEINGYDTPKITRDALKWLQKDGENNFFLYLHYHAPHAPYRAPFRDIFSTFEGTKDLSSGANILRWLYRSEVTFTDRYLEKLFSGIKKLGLLDSTDIILTADHGEQHSFHHYTSNEEGADATVAFFDHGATLLNDEVKIPLIFKTSQNHKLKGQEKYVSNLDIGPTLLDLAQLKIPSWCTGTSLISSKIEKNRTIGTEGFRKRAIITDNRYKYTKSYKSTYKTAFQPNKLKSNYLRLFESEKIVDLHSDPKEELNLIFMNKSLTKKLRKEFDRYYNTEFSYELIVESPEKKPISVLFNSKVPNPKPLIYNYSNLKNESYFSTSKQKRMIIPFKTPWKKKPLVFVNDKRIAIRKTYARINLKMQLSELPKENPGEAWLLPIAKKANAYVRKVEDSKAHNREITTENPAFEKILRDWGYLNDN